MKPVLLVLLFLAAPAAADQRRLPSRVRKEAIVAGLITAREQLGPRLQWRGLSYPLPVSNAADILGEASGRASRLVDELESLEVPQLGGGRDQYIPMADGMSPEGSCASQLGTRGTDVEIEFMALFPAYGTAWCRLAGEAVLAQRTLFSGDGPQRRSGFVPDAFMHAYSSALMRRYLGARVSYIGQLVHEATYDQERRVTLDYDAFRAADVHTNLWAEALGASHLRTNDPNVIMRDVLDRIANGRFLMIDPHAPGCKEDRPLVRTISLEAFDRLDNIVPGCGQDLGAPPPQRRWEPRPGQ